jgi:hypothetical protein
MQHACQQAAHAWEQDASFFLGTHDHIFLALTRSPLPLRQARGAGGWANKKPSPAGRPHNWLADRSRDQRISPCAHFPPKLTLPGSRRASGRSLSMLRITVTSTVLHRLRYAPIVAQAGGGLQSGKRLSRNLDSCTTFSVVLRKIATNDLHESLIESMMFTRFRVSPKRRP